MTLYIPRAIYGSEFAQFRQLKRIGEGVLNVIYRSVWGCRIQDRRHIKGYLSERKLILFRKRICLLRRLPVCTFVFTSTVFHVLKVIFVLQKRYFGILNEQWNVLYFFSECIAFSWKNCTAQCAAIRICRGYPERSVHGSDGELIKTRIRVC